MPPTPRGAVPGPPELGLFGERAGTGPEEDRRVGRDRLRLWCPLEPGASPPGLERVSCTPGDGSSRCAFGCGCPRPRVSVPCYCHPPSFVPPGAVYEQTDVHRAGWRLGGVWGDMNPGLWAAWHGAGCLCPPRAPRGTNDAQQGPRQLTRAAREQGPLRGYLPRV